MGDVLDEDDFLSPVWRAYLEAFDDLLHALSREQRDDAERRMGLLLAAGSDLAGFERRSVRRQRDRKT